MRWAPLLLTLLTPGGVFACDCLATYSVCRQVASSDMVFIGRVEIVPPPVLDPPRWKNPSAAVSAAEFERLRQDESRPGLARLKAAYFAMLGEPPDYARRELDAAVRSTQVEHAFNSMSSQGRPARFDVRRVFRENNDDDGPQNGKDDDDRDKPVIGRELTVWTGTDDCGIDFQPGETYLVYAGNDEQTGRLITSVCNRTRRLSDAGADLAYLHFYRAHDKTSLRLDGFVTTQTKQERLASLDAVAAPASDRLIELTGNGKVRYAESAADGRFAFDGLGAGTYEISVFDNRFPRIVKALAGPNQVVVREKGCATTLLVVPQTAQ